MADNVFFIDDELVERLMRGDTAPATASKKKRPATSSSLASAVALASAGRIDGAIKELEAAAARGESPAEGYSGPGHLRFEQQHWEEAAASSRKVVEGGTNHSH